MFTKCAYWVGGKWASDLGCSRVLLLWVALLPGYIAALLRGWTVASLTYCFVLSSDSVTAMPCCIVAACLVACCVVFLAVLCSIPPLPHTEFLLGGCFLSNTPTPTALICVVGVESWGA